MKFTEKYRQEGQTLYVPESLSPGSIEAPSDIFVSTVKSMTELGFSDKSELEITQFVEKCKEIFANIRR